MSSRSSFRLSAPSTPAAPGSGSRSRLWSRSGSSSSRSGSARAAAIGDSPAGAASTRLLVVVSRPVEDPATIVGDRQAVAGGSGSAADVLVLAPARIGFLDRWASDLEAARREAQQNLVITVASLAKAGVAAEARVGDEDLVQAVEDTMQSFAATEVILITAGADSDPAAATAAAELESRLRARFRRLASTIQQLAEAQRRAGRHHEVVVAVQEPGAGEIADRPLDRVALAESRPARRRSRGPVRRRSPGSGGDRTAAPGPRTRWRRRSRWSSGCPRSLPCRSPWAAKSLRLPGLSPRPRPPAVVQTEHLKRPRRLDRGAVEVLHRAPHRIGEDEGDGGAVGELADVVADVAERLVRARPRACVG